MQVTIVPLSHSVFYPVKNQMLSFILPSVTALNLEESKLLSVPIG